MVIDFRKTAQALVESILNAQCGVPPGDSQIEMVTQFILQQHARMTDYLRGPLRFATIAFDAAALPRAAKPFHQLDLASRSRQVERWRKSKIGTQRDLILFFERLAIFGFYSMIEGAAHGT